MIAPWLLITLFTVGMLGILYITQKDSRSFDEFAVGGRSYGTWYVGMSYAVSWIAGTFYTGFLGLTVREGVFGFYVLAFSIIGVAFMYLIASRAWRWGKRFDLRSQPDLMGIRYDSIMAKRISSIIGIIGLFPLLIVSAQAMAVVFRVASNNEMSITASLIIGLVYVSIRQYWTIRMGMRGLIMTDMFQGLICAVAASMVCFFMLSGAFGSPIQFSNITSLSDDLLQYPGDGGDYGPLYMGSQILMGVIATMCWPTSFQRVYTASSVRTVKSGTLASMLILFGFYLLSLLMSLAAADLPSVSADPQSVWFTLFEAYGGPWMLGLAVIIILAANVGWMDGGVQVIGIQISNDLINGGRKKRYSDYKATVIAKAVIIIAMALAAIGAYFSFNFGRLSLIVQIGYECVVQIGPALLLGIFWKRGNKQGAIAGMVIGFSLAVVLTAIWPDDIRAIGSITGGTIALLANLMTYIACAYAFPKSLEEKRRIDQLFAAGERTRNQEQRDILSNPIG